MLTQSELKSLLHYCPDTGVFTWVVSPSQRVKAGSVAGRINNNGYIHIKIKGKLYLGHRLAWLYAHGTFPSGFLDHINMNKADNRMSNLRNATQSENGFNQGLYSNNTSSYKGVSYNKQAKKWRAYCSVNGKQNHLGLFDNAEAAFIAYQNFASVNHGIFFNSGINPKVEL